MPDENPLAQLLAEHQHEPRTRLVFAENAIESIGELAASLNASHALVVTDQGVRKVGHVDRAIQSLDAAGIRNTIFDNVHENPTTRDVDECLSVAKQLDIDLLIGLGGGSSMDTTKGCNFLLTNGGQMKDYWGIGKATKPMLPLIAVPTTAGTGSEMQSFALIADETTHQKMACGDPKASAAIALLDPTLTTTQPTSVTACTGVDAIAHAVETGVCTKRNELSVALSTLAFELTFSHLQQVIENPDDLKARSAMLLGAATAGLAIENSMLGAAHSAANPLTAHEGVTHGHAVGIMLPHVVRFNGNDPDIDAHYQAVTGRSSSELADQLESLLDALSMSRTVTVSEDIPQYTDLLANEAAGQWTAQFNPRPIKKDDFVALYGPVLTKS